MMHQGPQVYPENGNFGEVVNGMPVVIPTKPIGIVDNKLDE